MFNTISLINIAFWLYLTSTIFYILYLVIRKEVFGKLATPLVGVGLLFNTLSLMARAIEARHAPFSNLFESMMLFTWALILLYLFFEYRYGSKSMGAFVVSLGFLSIGAASMLPVSYKGIEPLNPALQSLWLEIHVITTFIGYAGFALAFGLSIMYLIRHRNDKKKKENSLWAKTLPSLELLDHLGYKSIGLGFPFLTIGIITGAIWANYAWGTYWSWDPKETWSLITWFIYGAYLHARNTAGWRGKRAAYLALIGFMSVLFTYWGVSFLLSGLHAYA